MLRKVSHLHPNIQLAESLDLRLLADDLIERPAILLIKCAYGINPAISNALKRLMQDTSKTVASIMSAHDDAIDACSLKCIAKRRRQARVVRGNLIPKVAMNEAAFDFESSYFKGWCRIIAAADPQYLWRGRV